MKISDYPRISALADKDLLLVETNNDSAYKGIEYSNVFAGFSDKGGATDPYFQNVALLLHGDRASGSNVIFNNGNHGYSVNIINSSVVNSSAKSLFSNCLQFNGASSLNCLSSAFNVANEDCTIEFFFNVDPARGSVLFEMRPDSTNGNYIQLDFDVNNNLNIYYNSILALTSPSAILLNTWYYVAVRKIQNITELWFQGTKIGQFTSNDWGSSGRIKFGENAYYAPGTTFYGCMDEIRFTIGTARDVSVIPTMPFPNN